MENETVSMKVVNPLAAGIDVGSRSHWVSVGQLEKDVREFGVYNQDLYAVADWLTEHQIKTVAMESTGTYWQNLHAVLIVSGFEVVLCNGKFTKNIQGKKTDVKDCQWLQKLHTLGLLSASFLPDVKTEQLRTYCRHRGNLLHSAASTSRKMQKYLRLLNLRLDVVVKDICGLTGLQIIRAIVGGQTDPKALAQLRHGNCRKSQEEIAKALHSNARKDYLFALQQELETYDHLQQKIAECDKEIDNMLDEIIGSDDNKRQHHIEAKPHKRINKNTPKNIDLNLKSYQMFEGTDLLAIEGMSYSTVLTLMSEVGIEGIRKFPTAKHFASWLRLAPNNKVSGGKLLSSKVPKGSNRLKIALRNAANAIGNLKDATPLRDFFARINFRKGRMSAISATARKLAVIIWNMVVKGMPYNNPEGYLYLDQKRKLGLVKRIRKQIEKYDLKMEDIGFSNLSFSDSQYYVSQNYKNTQLMMIVNSIFNSPHFIFIKATKESANLIFEKLELSDWKPLESTINEDVVKSENRYFFTTQIEDWFHIMDDWNYTLWFDNELIQRIQNLSNYFEIFTCSIGDCDSSFDFRLFKDGEIKREFVVEDPNMNGGVVTKNIGNRLQGEKEALEKDSTLGRVISIANNIGISTDYNIDNINGYWREEFENEKFFFDETEYQKKQITKAKCPCTCDCIVHVIQPGRCRQLPLRNL